MTISAQKWRYANVESDSRKSNNSKLVTFIVPYCRYAFYLVLLLSFIYLLCVPPVPSLIYIVVQRNQLFSFTPSFNSKYIAVFENIVL